MDGFTAGSHWTAWRWELNLTAGGKVEKSVGTKLSEAQAEGGLLKFTLLDERLPLPAAAKHPGLTGTLRIQNLPAGKFTLFKVRAGSYDIRYMDLSDGGLSRSETFSLVETPIYNGTKYSNVTMTLYKVKNGNMQTYGLSEAEF